MEDAMGIGIKMTGALLFCLSLSAMPAACAVTTTDAEDQAEAVDLQGQTEIEAVERSLGVDLIKELKTISDERNNSVTLLVASQRRDLVDNFLNNTDISIEILPSFMPTVSSNGGSVAADLGKEEPPSARGLMLEVVSKSFGPDTQAFSLKFRSKRELQQDDHGAVPADGLGEAVSALSETHESALYIEGFQIDYLSFACDACNNQMTVEHYSRSCGVCSYYLHAKKVLYPGQSWYSCNDARRTKVKITGTYDASFYNWNLTFVNCA
jgi:hypothetical protein